MMKQFLPLIVLFAPFLASVVSQTTIGYDVSFNNSTDICKVNETETGENVYGNCIPEVHFPFCEEGKEFICYNRINRRDLFYEDKQPHYYIDPKRVFCYDLKVLDNGGGCKTCITGRFCMSEGRCIMDDANYECDQWWDGGLGDENA